jgi:DNA-binding CsgD family transcriptional regulator
MADALYDVTTPVEPWLANVLKLVLSHYPYECEGLGGISEIESGEMRIVAMVSTSPQVDALVRRTGITNSRRYVAMRNSRPFSSDHQLVGTHSAALPHTAALANLGARDLLGLCGFDPRGRAAVMSAFLTEPAGEWPTNLVLEWDAIAFHLIAAASLRRGLELGDVRAEATLSEDGKILHAEGDAVEHREPLIDAVRRIHRSRGRWRDKPSELEARTPSVDGRWTLVDQFESDGRHFLVAHVAEKDVGSPELSSRERRVADHLAAGWSMKRIAYRLGLSEGAVASYAHRASTKLGVRGRIALSRALRSQGRR